MNDHEILNTIVEVIDNATGELIFTGKPPCILPTNIIKNTTPYKVKIKLYENQL